MLTESRLGQKPAFHLHSVRGVEVGGHMTNDAPSTPELHDQTTMAAWQFCCLPGCVFGFHRSVSFLQPRAKRCVSARSPTGPGSASQRARKYARKPLPRANPLHYLLRAEGVSTAMKPSVIGRARVAVRQYMRERLERKRVLNVIATLAQVAAIKAAVRDESERARDKPDVMSCRHMSVLSLVVPLVTPECHDLHQLWCKRCGAICTRARIDGGTWNEEIWRTAALNLSAVDLELVVEALWNRGCELRRLGRHRDGDEVEQLHARLAKLKVDEELADPTP